MISSSSVKLVDTCFLNETPFFNVSGVGFDAYISQKFSEIKGRGFANYIRAVISHYHKASNTSFTLKLEEKEILENAFFISFANTSQFGNNVHIAPEACNDDGLVDIVVVAKIPLYLMPLFAFKLFTKKKIKGKYVKYYRAHMIDVTCEPMSVHVDGEPVAGTCSHVRVAVKPFSLRVLA
jgi:diacylglycerol kinase family enzyme